MSLSWETLQSILESEDLDRLAFSDLVGTIERQSGMAQFAPDGVCQIDPRNGDRVLFNTARARRPHDNRPTESKVECCAGGPPRCVIGEGKTTTAIDVRRLSDGCTFINKNLFPMLYPKEAPGLESPQTVNGKLSSRGMTAFGLHFLQWTSSHHDRDWHNMPLDDLKIVMERLGALEKKLLEGEADRMPDNSEWGDAPGRRAFVSIIKNYGRLVGGSLAHGHQQIVVSSVMPRRFLDNLKFENQHGERFTKYLLRENPVHLTVRDYGKAALVVPYFMKRPYDMLLVIKDTSRRYIHELSAEEREQAARGWHDATRMILEVMPRVGREPAFNVTTHSGPGAGLYFEFLPYTQETGGYEQLGLFICQGNPKDCAANLREIAG